jgi:hypothetical protein
MATANPGKLSIEEKLSTALNFKDEGNELYKTKDYKKAYNNNT